MDLAAVLFAILTVLVGVFVLGDVVGPPGAGVKRLAATHVGVALAGVALLLVALVNASRGTAWISFAALVAAAAVGLATLTVNRAPGEDITPEVRKQQGHLPVPVVVVHGAAALFTLVLVLAAAASSGAIR